MHLFYITLLLDEILSKLQHCCCSIILYFWSDFQQFWFWISVKSSDWGACLGFLRRTQTFDKIFKFCLDVWAGRFCLLVAFLENPNFNSNIFPRSCILQVKIAMAKSRRGQAAFMHSISRITKKSLSWSFYTKDLLRNTFVWAVLLIFICIHAEHCV